MSIIAAFNSASHSYDGAADIQLAVAAQLIADAGALSPRSVLDIGCGTGLLTGLAQARWPDAKITGIDAAPAMLERARAKLPAVRFVQADAEKIALEEKFDLVLSSMVLHWLADPARVFSHWQSLLAPQGRLLTALPVEGSLSEWTALCESHAAPGRLWRFPSPQVFGEHVTITRHAIVHPSVRDFLYSMKHTGAAVPNPETAPTGPALLRRMLRAAPKPFVVSFMIATLAHTKTGPHSCEPASS
jgi:malonyl-ACP O-methyltransferase BioC